MKSIRNRLLAALLVLVALISLLSGFVTYHRVFAESSTIFDYQLRQMALSLRSQVSVAPRIVIPQDKGDSDFVVQIWDPFGTRIYLSRPGLPIMNRTVLGYADLSLNGEKWRAFGLQTADGVIQIAQPLQVREALARRAALRVLIPLFVLLPLMFIAIAGIVGSGLSPLRNVAAQIQRRDAGSLTQLDVSTLPKEIVPLVNELNRLLNRLQRAFTAQRAFISDAAHELRSPLTALRLQVQLLDRAPDDAARLEARVSLGAAIERAIHLVEQLLALARSEPPVPGSESINVDLAEPAALAIGDTHTLAATRNIELSLDAPAPALISGDPESLRTLARNLIDNAVRYTPANGHVQVLTRTDPTHAILEVIDDGPGIPSEDRNRVFDRFFRRATAQETGSGLGLAIVKAIAERHDAQVEVADVQPAGLRVTVRFPRSD